MPVSSSTQSGMALLVSLVFLLLLSLLGLASMDSAVQQEKMTGSVLHANHSFQAAETALRSGESWVSVHWSGISDCRSPSRCAPPAEVRTQKSAGMHPISGIHWVPVVDGLYGVQSLGLSITPTHFPVTTSTRLYRVTGIGVHGQSRTVLESILAHYQDLDGEDAETGPRRLSRVMWRQIQ